MEDQKYIGRGIWKHDSAAKIGTITVGRVGFSVRNHIIMVTFMQFSKLIVPLVAVILIIVAIGVGIVAPVYLSRGSAAVEALTPLSITELEQAQPGMPVAVEGRINLNVPTEYNVYAAYWLQKPRNNTSERRNSSDDWETDTVVTPPLLLDLPDGPVRVVNEDYNLGSVSDWQDIDSEAGPRRIGGLRVGDPVFAIATLRSNNDGVRLEASVVTRGTKASYLADQRIAWWICVSLGAVCGIAAIVLLWARMAWNKRAR